MILHSGQVSPSSYSSLYAVIPARSGSKGLPDKNILRLSGLPLAEHSLAFAQDLGIFDGVILTTDCDFLLSRKRLYGNTLYHARSSFLAQDTTSLVDVIIDIFDTGFVPSPGANPAFVLLQPTSPFRSADEFRDAISYSLINYPQSLVFVSRANHHPSENIILSGNDWGYVVPPPQGTSRRQDYPQVAYFISGSSYLSTLSNLRAHRSFVNKSTSFWLSEEPYSVDIDSKFDFTLADNLYDLMLSYGYAFDVSTLPLACRK